MSLDSNQDEFPRLYAWEDEPGEQLVRMAALRAGNQNTIMHLLTFQRPTSCAKDTLRAFVLFRPILVLKPISLVLDQGQIRNQK